MSAIESQSLFRPEVAAARRHRLEGEILLRQPLRAHVLTLLLAGIAAALAAWVSLGSYTRSELARGLLVTGRPATKVVALRPGQVAALHVEDGDRVTAGQKLATILVEQASEDGASATAQSLAAIDAQRRLARRQVGLAHRRQAAERARLAATMTGLDAQRAELAVQITLQEQLVASAQETVDRIGKVVERGQQASDLSANSWARSLTNKLRVPSMGSAASAGQNKTPEHSLGVHVFVSALPPSRVGLAHARLSPLCWLTS